MATVELAGVDQAADAIAAVLESCSDLRQGAADLAAKVVTEEIQSLKDKGISPMRIPWERPIALRHVPARASMGRRTETFTAWLGLYVATTAGFASADAA